SSAKSAANQPFIPASPMRDRERRTAGRSHPAGLVGGPSSLPLPISPPPRYFTRNAKASPSVRSRPQGEQSRRPRRDRRIELAAQQVTTETTISNHETSSNTDPICSRHSDPQATTRSGHHSGGLSHTPSQNTGQRAGWTHSNSRRRGRIGMLLVKRSSQAA